MSYCHSFCTFLASGDFYTDVDDDNDGKQYEDNAENNTYAIPCRNKLSPLQDDDIGYVFTAVDEDEGENATLTFNVTGTYREKSNENMDLFRAEDEEFSIDSCR